MKFTVVTVCFNSSRTIADCAGSVLAQRGLDVEYIIIDGGSRDDTLARLAPFRNGIAQLVSEPDKGVYDAMNKGIARATGDFVGFLNSDDYFRAPDALAALARSLERSGADATLADIEQIDTKGNVVRILKGEKFRPSQFRWGVCPPHPTFYARRKLLADLGGFADGYRIAGDYELMLRFFSLPNVRWDYVPRRLVTMRVGGISNQGLSSYTTISREMIRACRASGLKPVLPAIHGRVLRRTGEVLAAYAERLPGNACPPNG